MRKFLLVVAALVAAGCSNPERLDKGNWSPEVYDALSELIAQYGSSSPGYDPDCRPYAVFDYDNTTVLGDISYTLVYYMLDNLKFGFTPEESESVFCSVIPDPDMLIPVTGPKDSVTVRSLARRFAEDYAAMYGRKDFRDMPEFEDLRTCFWNMALGIDNTVDYGTSCLWFETLFTGYTKAGLRTLSRKAASHATADGTFREETWRSGGMDATVSRGLALTPELQDLYTTLTDNGIDVYICSASMEEIVEGMACDPKYDLGIKDDHVFGLRLLTHEDCTIDIAYDPGYPQSYKEGKTDCIRTMIAPLHGGASPVLVAGDSNGDYSMLTSFPDLKVGLIFDCGNSGDIGALAETARNDRMPLKEHLRNNTTKYVLQPRDLSIPGLIKEEHE